jgi:hypothetical protein
MIRKGIALILLLLFFGMMINPSTGNITSFDDNTPPVTTHSLNPPEPDGENGWYVSNVTITLNATDNESGVDRIEYRIQGGSWQTIPGDNGTFLFGDDGNDVLIEYRAYDNAGNKEDTNSFIIDMDQSIPIMNDFYFSWEGYPIKNTWYIDFICEPFDYTSRMDRVEMYVEDKYYETVGGGGPDFLFTIQWFDGFRTTKFYFHCYDRAGNKVIYDWKWINAGPPPMPTRYIGIIQNPIITDKYISFFAVLVFVRGGYSWIFIPFILRQITFPHCYSGFIGKHFIFAWEITGPPY